MKEATGELNMTVITVVAIAAVAAFFYAFVWPAIRNNLQSTTKCNAAVCPPCDSAMCECTYYEGEGENAKEETIKCKNPEYVAGNK